MFAEIFVFQDLIPILVGGCLVFGIFSVLSLLSQRNSRTHARLERISRPASLAEIEDPKLTKKERFQGFKDVAQALSSPMMPQTELEQSELKIKLANAGFRSDSAVAVYLGIRFAVLMLSLVVSVGIWLPKYGLTFDALKPIVAVTGVGFYLPAIGLWWLRSKRQQEI